MSEFQVEGDALKKLIKLARNQPVSFAFAPGTSDPNHYLAMHKRKLPSLIAKSARKAVQANKVAYGTFTVDGRNMALTCDKTVSNLAKKVKQHLRDDKLTMNIIVMDQFGNILESDIDEIDDPDPLGDVDAEEAAPDEDHEDAALDTLEAVLDAEEIDPEDADDSLDPAALAARAKAMAPRLAAVEGPLAAKLKEGFEKSLAQLRDGQLETAAGSLDTLGAALAKVAASVNPDEIQAVSARIASLQPQLKSLDPSPKTARLAKAFGQAVDLVKARDTARANQVLDAFETALEGAKQVQLKSRLTHLRARLKGQTGPTATKLEQGLTVAESALLAGQIPQAEKALDTLAKAFDMLSPNASGITESQKAWHETRLGLRDALTRLKAAAAPDAETVLGYLDRFDDRLETTLKAILETPDGDARARLKAKAQGIVAEYHAELDTPFFRAVGAEDGFTNVSVRSRAVEALNSVTEALQ